MTTTREAPADLPAPVSLAGLPAGTRAVVRMVRGGQTVVSRLGAMGLVADAALEVLQNRDSGPVLILLRDTRIALGRGEAAKVLVELAS